MISEYIAELCCLTQFCDYRMILNDMLSDRLIYSVNYNQTQQKLLREESSLTRERALSIAV